jgi:hypothetical protein
MRLIAHRPCRPTGQFTKLHEFSQLIPGRDDDRGLSEKDSRSRWSDAVGRQRCARRVP